MIDRNEKPRLFIHAKEVELLTGKGYRSALKLLMSIRKVYGKPAHSLVSIAEFCEYMHVEEGDVMKRLT